MKRPSISLTGASGFVGWHVAEAFRDAGWSVRGLVRRGSRKSLPAGVDRVVAPLDDADALTRGAERSDVIVHAAALIRASSQAAFDRVNVQGTRAVIQAANRTNARLVFISSLAAVGQGTPAAPCHEDDDPQPVNAYGRSKLAAERAVRQETSVPWTILRPCAVYGPRDRGFLVLFRLASRGIFPDITEPSTAFTLIEVGDLARAVVLAAEAPRAVGRAIFVGHPEPHTAQDFQRELAVGLKRSYRPLPVPGLVINAIGLAGDLCWKAGFKPPLDSGRVRELRARGFVCAVDRARDLLGFTARTSLTEGIGRTLAWYRAERWL